MAIANPRRKMTEDEFMRLPKDGYKYELVDGEVKVVPAGYRHDVIGMMLGIKFYPFAVGRGYLSGSQAGFRMKNGNIRCPDVAFTSKARLPDGEPPEGFVGVAPDLAVEIISHSEEAADMQRKLEEYFDAGSIQVWHLFPKTQAVRLYTSPTQFVEYAADEEIDGGNLLPGFHCRVAELFALE